MIELGLGFILGALFVGLCKSSIILNYEEDLQTLEKENQELTAKLNKVLKINESLNKENERFRNRISELLEKLGVYCGRS